MKVQDALRFVVSNPTSPESLLQNFAMSTQHDVFVLLTVMVAGGLGFMMVYRICETLERIFKKNG